MRHTADTITDDDLDALYERMDLMRRALERAASLCDQWTCGPATLDRDEAMDQLADALRLDGWQQSAAVPRLSVVPESPTTLQKPSDGHRGDRAAPGRAQ